MDNGCVPVSEVVIVLSVLFSFLGLFILIITYDFWTGYLKVRFGSWYEFRPSSKTLSELPDPVFDRMYEEASQYGPNDNEYAYRKMNAAKRIRETRRAWDKVLEQ